jgi:hypothetical protein
MISFKAAGVVLLVGLALLPLNYGLDLIRRKRR